MMTKESWRRLMLAGLVAGAGAFVVACDQGSDTGATGETPAPAAEDGTTIVDDAVDAATEAAEGAVDAASDAVDAATEAASDAADAASDAVDAAVDAAADAVDGAEGAADAAADDAADDAADAVKGTAGEALQ